MKVTILYRSAEIWFNKDYKHALNINVSAEHEHVDMMFEDGEIDETI